MKRILFILFLCCIGSGLAACQDEDHTVPTCLLYTSDAADE